MEQITSYKPNLSTTQISIYNELSGCLIKELADNELAEAVKTAVCYAYANSGIKSPDENELAYQIKEFAREMKDHYPTVRKGEILIALKRGILKEYGDYFGLNLATFVHFVRNYSIHNDRMNALRMLNTPAEEKYIPIQAEVFEMSKKNVLRSFEDYKNGREIILPSVIYDFLDKVKVIQISLEKKKEFYEKAKEQLLKEGKSAVNSAPDSIKKSIATSRLEEIINGIDTDSVKSRAKKLSLEFFFESCEEMDVDLSSEIGDYKPNK